MINEEKRWWEAEFVKGVKKDEMFDVIMAANYLDSKTLMDVAVTLWLTRSRAVKEYFYWSYEVNAETNLKLIHYTNKVKQKYIVHLIREFSEVINTFIYYT